MIQPQIVADPLALSLADLTSGARTIASSATNAIVTAVLESRSAPMTDWEPERTARFT